MAALAARFAATNPAVMKSFTQGATTGMKDAKSLDFIKQATGNLMKDPKALDALKKTSADLTEKFSNGASGTKSTSTTYQTVRTMSVGLCRVLAFLWDKLKEILRFLFLTRSPAAYVVWLIIIIAIIIGAVVGTRRRNSRLARNPNVKDTKDKKQKPKSSVLSEEPTNEGWRRRAVQQTAEAGSIVDGYQRNLLSGGRCDGLNWLSDPDSKKDCLKNLPPPTIRWEFNSDDYPEMKDLPETLLNQKNDQQSVNIPYRLVGDRFYADCSNMTYQDGSNAKLFIQKNIKDSTCQFIEKSSTPFKDEKRKKEFKDRYTICAK